MNSGSRRVILPRAGGFFLALAALGIWAGGPGSNMARAQFPVADITIALPAPPGQGMVELGSDRTFFDPAVPDSNRLLAAFVLQTQVATLHTIDKQALTPYALVEVLRDGESTTESPVDFKGLVDSISQQMGSTLDSSFKESQDEFNRRMKAMNLNVQVNYGKPMLLGTFFLKPDAWAFGMTAPVTANGQTTIMVVGTVLLRVKSHVVFAYYYQVYKDDQTPSQLRAETEQWTDAILAANQ